MTNPTGENPYRRYPGHEETPDGYPGAYQQQVAMNPAGPPPHGEQPPAPNDMFAAREAYPPAEMHPGQQGQPEPFGWANSPYAQGDPGMPPAGEPNPQDGPVGPSTAAMPQVDQPYPPAGQQWNTPPTSGYPTPAEYAPVPPEGAAPAPAPRAKSSRSFTGLADRGAQLRTALHAIALVAGLIGIVLISQDSTFQAREISIVWLVFAVLAVLAQTTGAVQGPVFAKVALAGVIGLVVFWVFIMLPHVTTAAGFFMVLAVGTAIAALATNLELRRRDDD